MSQGTHKIWLDRAAQMRALAITMKDPEVMILMTDLAADYEELADRGAVRTAKLPSGRGLRSGPASLARHQERQGQYQVWNRVCRGPNQGCWALTGLGCCGELNEQRLFCKRPQWKPLPAGRKGLRNSQPTQTVEPLATW